MLRSPHLDFVAVTASYHDRELGQGADYARAPITSVGLHGGYFDDPALMAEVKRLNSLLDKSRRYDCSSVAEILVDDLAVADLDRYKLVIFPNCFHLSDTQRRPIRRSVLNRDRIVLWCYAPELIHGRQTSVRAMQDLRGFRLALSAKPDRVQARIRECYRSD